MDYGHSHLVTLKELRTFRFFIFLLLGTTGRGGGYVRYHGTGGAVLGIMGRGGAMTSVKVLAM